MKKKTVLIVQMLSFYSLAGLLLIIGTSPRLRASASLSFPCQTEVSGKVSSADDGSLLPGVNVVVKGAPTIGTTTDSRGQFRLSVPDGNDTLVFSYIGYEERTVPINGRTTVNVQLALSSKSLNELVVTGYMTQKKADLTGAVSVVSSAEIAKTHGATNVLTAMQGKVPGMYITADGDPAGNATGVQIRGLTSVNGAPPLIVIDGTPAPGLNLRDINANNIASIQVLKDAYSASIYGAQGAGGVILIQTKHGVPGKLTVTYNGTVGFSDWMNKPKLLNTQQYGQALWQAAVNSGLDPNQATRIYTFLWHKNGQGIPVLDQVTPIKQFNDTMFSANTDWLKAISKPGLQMDHQITVSGGTDKSSTLFSLDYFENNGFIIYTGYKRYTARLNTNYKLINDHFNIGEDLEVSRMNIGTEPYNGDIHQAMVEPSIIPVYTKNGGWGGTAVGLGMDDYWNPVRDLTLNKDNRNKYNKIIGDVHANVYFLKHFTFHTQLGLIYTEGYHRNIGFTFREGGGKVGTISSVDQWYWWEANEDWTNTLDYKLSKGKSEIDALIGTEASQYLTENMDGNRQEIQFQNYNYAYLSTATGNTSVGGSGDKYTFLSYFGKVNYVYDSKYLLSGSLRYDGSSKFGINNQFGLFPSLSAGWIISQEKFMQAVPSVSSLKLRASWGVNGNSNIPTGATESLYAADYNSTSYAIAGNPTGNNPSGFYRLSTGNPDLKWETSKQTDVGIDFGFFNQRLTGTIDYYRKATNGMLFRPPYLGTIGEGGYQWVNAADMSDKGIELEIGYQSNPNKEFQWGIIGNISHNQNRVTNLPVNVKYAYGGSAFKGDNIDGHPLHSWYGFIADGLFKTQKEVDNSPYQPGKGLGRIRYKDLSGPEGKPDDTIDYNYDQTWIGSWDPKVTFGISLNASWKNFDFYMFWQGVAGNTVYDEWKTYSDLYNVWVQNGFNHPVRILNAWSLSNPNSNIPAMAWVDANNELRMSTYLLASGDYLKLRNIQIGYSLPHKLISKLDIQKFRIYIMAQNLITVKKWWGSNAYVGPDPETQIGPGDASYNNAYVVPLICKTGVDVTF
ncbi:MAG: TonB-dependent receptor [Chitinophagaceae bacterium]|nr:MAG: TonB-dependent receptor [Chitinophagaceae bacterium]